MENHRQQPSPASSPSRRSLKRKLGEDFEGDNDSHRDLMRKVRAQVEIIDSVSSPAEEDRSALKNAIGVLSDLAKNKDMVNVIVECGAVPPLVKHLQSPPPPVDGDVVVKLRDHEVEKGSAFTIGLLAIKTSIVLGSHDHEKLYKKITEMTILTMKDK